MKSSNGPTTLFLSHFCLETKITAIRQIFSCFHGTVQCDAPLKVEKKSQNKREMFFSRDLFSNS